MLCGVGAVVIGITVVICADAAVDDVVVIGSGVGIRSSLKNLPILFESSSESYPDFIS